MTFIKSSDIKVYPASSRGIASKLTPYNDNPESKLVTENNIVTLINRLAKIRNNTNKSGSSIEINHSFVISDSYSSNPFEICMNGYYFRINNLSTYINDIINNPTKDTSIYAKIIVKSKSDNYLVSELAGYSDGKVIDDLDDNASNSTFIALSLDTTPTPISTDTNHYELCILTYDGNNWVIPPTSKIVITADYVGLSDYNGNLHNLYEYFEKDSDGNLIIKQSHRAKELQTSHTLWGQTFNGTQDVSGNLTNVENIIPQTGNTYSVGTDGDKFKDVYTQNLNATDVNTENIKGNSINPSTTSGSSIGSSDKYYENAYINNVHSTNATSTNITTSNLTDVTSITCKENSIATIGEENKKFKNVYAETFNGNSTTTSQLQTTRNIKITGDASGNVDFNGTSDVTLTLDVSKAAALDSTNKGSSSQPVYFNNEGKPVVIGYTINKSVPSDAILTEDATSSTHGLMTASDKSKLDGIAANANNYTLPGATATTLGGIKISFSDGILTIKTS